MSSTVQYGSHDHMWLLGAEMWQVFGLRCAVRVKCTPDPKGWTQDEQCEISFLYGSHVEMIVF